MNIKADKIIIRDWEEADFENYLYWNTGKFEWMNFNGPYYPLKTLEELKVGINKLKSGKETTSKVIAAIDTNQLIGTVGWYWQSKETNWMSIGLAIYDDKKWGQGIGFEALGLWTEYLFQVKDKIIRLDLRTWSGNIGMMKLAEKLGYKLEGQFRKARIVNGKYFDSMAYGLLKSEWIEKYPDGFTPLNEPK